MDKRIKLAFVGGGSYTWAPRILTDLMLIPDIPGIDFYLLDKDLESAGLIKRLGEKMNGELKKEHRFVAGNNEEEAFSGSDFVIICISTGGLEAMRHDLAIPEKYGIYQTVGDTVGPGGWSRNMRNIPVFNDLARTIERWSPQAVVLNYTNPMACLTKAFYARTKLRTVGLCHGLFENYRVLMELFGLKSEKEMSVRFGGVNHFFWMLDLKIRGQDGYAMLKEKLGADKRLVDLIQEVHQDEIGFESNKYLTTELYETFGYMPYVGDRHTCEFVSHMITGSEERLQAYRIHRTTIEERYAGKRKQKEAVEQMLAGTKPVSYKRTRETAADIVEAVALGREFIDVINVPNQGQIPNLPLGGVVETLGVIHPLGFTPLSAGPLPEPIRRIVLPHLENSELLYEAASTANMELALEALYNDPTCRHLDYKDIRSMAGQLMEANRPYMESQNTR